MALWHTEFTGTTLQTERCFSGPKRDSRVTGTRMPASSTVPILVGQHGRASEDRRVPQFLLLACCKAIVAALPRPLNLPPN